jgi:hypothetical protein
LSTTWGSHNTLRRFSPILSFESKSKVSTERRCDSESESRILRKSFSLASTGACAL